MGSIGYPGIELTRKKDRPCAPTLEDIAKSIFKSWSLGANGRPVAVYGPDSAARKDFVSALSACFRENNEDALVEDYGSDNLPGNEYYSARAVLADLAI